MDCNVAKGDSVEDLRLMMVVETFLRLDSVLYTDIVIESRERQRDQVSGRWLQSVNEEARQMPRRRYAANN